MRHAASGLPGDGGVKPANRFEQRFRTLIRFHEQNRRPSKLGKNQRNQQRLRRIGETRETNFTPKAAQLVASFLDGRPAGDSREKLGNERENHTATL